MRLLTCLLFLLSALPLLAQPSLPVSVTKTPTPYDLHAILEREGEKTTLTVSTTAIWNGTSSGGGHYIGGASLPIGKAFKLASGSVSASAKAYLYFSYGGLLNFGNAPVNFDYFQFSPGGGQQEIRFDEDSWLSPGSSGGGLYIQRVWGADSLTRAQQYSAVLRGRQITADLNFGAAKKFQFIGTSITAGTGPTKTQTMHAFLLRGYLRDSLNYDVRLINQSMSGSTTAQVEDYRQQGRYNVGPVDLVGIELGTNDGGQNVPTATYLANLDRLIRDRRRWNPKALIFVVAPPYRNDAFEANLANYRAALPSFINGFSDPRLIYIAGTGSLISSATSAANTTDGIHYNDAGNRLLYWKERDAIVSWKTSTGLALP